ncbi:MAG TPA: hypothetical protein VK654_17060 [Nitrospirota bacterium]|nr:hypothetical protein [Nitrospirota bacterium]
MTALNTKKQKTLYMLSIAVLVIGLCSAVAIYLIAHAAEEASSLAAGDSSFQNPAETSKKYIHDLEVFGGHAAVLSDKFIRWFNSLWEGETLAYTVGSIALFLSLCLYLAAKYEAVPEVHDRGEPDQRR